MLHGQPLCILDSHMMGKTRKCRKQIRSSSNKTEETEGTESI